LTVNLGETIDFVSFVIYSITVRNISTDGERGDLVSQRLKIRGKNGQSTAIQTRMH
jgi:hypothetical protein